MNGNNVLDVDSVSVNYKTDGTSVQALRDVSINIQEEETVGIAGESGSGKSTLALAILRYLDENGRITHGSIRFDDIDLKEISDKGRLQSIRGNRIAHVPQDPSASLNPSMKVGKQIAETIKLHRDMSTKEAKRESIDMLKRVRITDPEYNWERYPHELSGGMQQRVLLAIGLSCNPDLLILDEPTTGLDVTTQSKILGLIDDLKEQYNTSLMLITHDLGVIAETASRIYILYAGEIMEHGTVSEVFNNPSNPYTQALLSAIPKIDHEADLSPIPGQIPDLTEIPSGCIFANRCEFATDECRSMPIELETVNEQTGHTTRCIRWEEATADPIEPSDKDTGSIHSGDNIIKAEDMKKYFGDESFFDSIFGSEPPVKAVDGVDLEVDESETLGLVGESGSGKTTVGRTLLNLLDITDGTVKFRDEDITSLKGTDLKEFRSECQLVFQNPESSLNPRHSVGHAVARPIKKFTDMDTEERNQRAGELLENVGLSEAYKSRYPHQLSGGEKQRVAIARAFAANPAFVVLDEPVSALDVSVQASILNLLQDLRSEYGASFLFISHDLSVINHISDRIAVMYLGEIVEVGSKEAIFEPPYHPYTRTLLSSNPSTDPDENSEMIHLEGDVPSPRDKPSGCPFHTRCPQKIGDICEQEKPDLESKEFSEFDDHQIACHLEEEEMYADTETIITDGSGQTSK